MVSSPALGSPVLDSLNATQQQWSPEPISFFVLCPAGDRRLADWYSDLYHLYEPRFTLHGHGWGPFWWLVRGTIVDCLTKPYEQSIEQLRERTLKAFEAAALN